MVEELCVRRTTLFSQALNIKCDHQFPLATFSANISWIILGMKKITCTSLAIKTRIDDDDLICHNTYNLKGTDGHSILSYYSVGCIQNYILIEWNLIVILNYTPCKKRNKDGNGED